MPRRLLLDEMFPQNHAFVSAVTNALNSLLADKDGTGGDVVFLSRS